MDWPEYEISALGNVRRNGKPLALFMVKGYLSFNVADPGRRRSLRVHREVARAFLPGFKGHVRHLDGNALNNHFGNLAWGSPKENEADKRAHGRILAGSKHPQAKLSEADAQAIRASRETGVALAKRFGVAPSQICAIRKGRSRF